MANPAPDVVGQVLDRLHEIAPALHQQFDRGAHRGRLEQIDAHIVTLASLIEQLPHEEVREAEYESRLLDRHHAGDDDPDNPHAVYPQSDHERLAEALAAGRG